HAPLQLSAGTSRPPDQLAARLVDLGYTRTDVVEHRGEFAVRGGIVDVFPSTARRPVRAEFYGDDIESLRQFSAATQLSTGRIDEEADALAQASGWPGPTAVHDPDLALSTRARVDLSELPAAGSVDLGIRTWERPGQSDRMAERTAELRAAGARVVLIGEGHG